MAVNAKSSTRTTILNATLKLMESSESLDEVTMRAVASLAGITPMAIYKHFKDRDALLLAAVAAEYRRLGGYFERANAKRDVPGLRGMLGYCDYALDHPQLFQFMFSGTRPDAFEFPRDLGSGKSPTFDGLLSVVSQLMERGVLRRDDVGATALSIWAHAHGLIALYQCGRINLPRPFFRKLYMQSLDRLLAGLVARGSG